VVDSTDLIVITTVVQTVVISLTLMVFIFQFRSQEKSIKEAAVQNVMSRYTDYVRMLVDNPGLSPLRRFAEDINLANGAKMDKLNPEDEAIFAYIMLGYGLMEEIFTLHKKKWIDDETWGQWSVFMERVSKHPLYRRVHEFTRGTFDKDFEEYVKKMMERKD